MTFWFDMDGTIADFYGVENWLDYLINEDSYPYKVAKPILDTEYFNKLCECLKKSGHEIGIVSWLSKSSTKEFDKRVRQAKREWLKKFFPRATKIHIVKYGTNKAKVVGNAEGAILFDDELRNRTQWTAKGGRAYEPKDILPILNEIALAQCYLFLTRGTYLIGK